MILYTGKERSHMRLTADYHTHTVFSHGKGSVEDNVKAAIEAGLSAVGITDHSIAHPFYGVKKRKVAEYIEEIERIKRKYENEIEVKSGLELNLIGLDGSVDKPEGYDFDILIAGYHKGALCKDLRTMWKFMTKRDVRRITEAYMLALQKGNIDIVSHPGYGVPVDYEMLAKACSDYGTLFEINNKHTDLRAEDISGLDVKFVVSSDAHSPEKVGRAENALKLVESSGLDINKIKNVGER